MISSSRSNPVALETASKSFCLKLRQGSFRRIHIKIRGCIKMYVIYILMHPLIFIILSVNNRELNCFTGFIPVLNSEVAGTFIDQQVSDDYSVSGTVYVCFRLSAGCEVRIPDQDLKGRALPWHWTFAFRLQNVPEGI